MRKFEGALAELDKNKDENIHPLLQKAHRDALRSQYDELRMELEEYDVLVQGKRDVLERRASGRVHDPGGDGHRAAERRWRDRLVLPGAEGRPRVRAAVQPARVLRGAAPVVASVRG